MAQEPAGPLKSLKSIESEGRLSFSPTVGALFCQQQEFLLAVCEGLRLTFPLSARKSFNCKQKCPSKSDCESKILIVGPKLHPKHL